MTHQIQKQAIKAPQVLNEAIDYNSAFSRGLRVELPGAAMILISGTASVDENGRSCHEGDFAAQVKRTYENITALLQAEGAGWGDVIKTRCYLKEMDAHYEAFNAFRTDFYHQQGLDPFPASVCVQAVLCRPELLVEIEVDALVSGR